MKIKAIIGIGVLLVITIASCQSDSELEFDRYYTTGKLVYINHCQNCHGVNGQGLGQLIPPLTDVTYLKTNNANLACAIQFGLKGKITVAGKAFEGDMPVNTLAPIELAEVLTYVGNSFGNKQGTVNVDQVNVNLSNCK